ncbi:MAG TPA: VOC family protein [Sphingomicrobium sp.]|jgi:predicted enzyme related to lactoylglutathione lyase
MPNRQGDFIWYELLTSDHARAKAFYDAAAGWDIEPQPAGPMDYRMIRAEDGNVGGVMQIGDDMRAHGARPTWLGYIGVDDVDATVSKAEAAGGKVLMPAFDIEEVGRLAMLADPFGAPFYVMRGSSDAESNVFSPDRVGHAAWKSSSLGTSTKRAISTCRCSDGRGAMRCRWAPWATTGSSSMADA